MSIVRAPRPEASFYVLNKEISEDRRLSWAARGLLVFLLGKPDHWRVSVQALVNETAEAVGRSTGRDAVYGLLAELQAVGYLQRVGQSRGEGGKMGGAEYLVHEIPVLPRLAEPCPEKPYTAGPGTGEPSTAKPTQASTDQKQGLKREQGLKRATAASALSRPSGVSEGVWNDFQRLRREKRAPLTETALQGIEREATRAGITLEEALRTCCERGWQGFRADWLRDQPMRKERGRLTSKSPNPFSSEPVTQPM